MGRIVGAVGSAALIGLIAWLGSRSFSGDDLTVYRAAGRALLDGRNPYTQGLRGTWITFSYTPFSTVVFLPLTELSQHAALFVLTALSLGCLIFVARRAVEEIWPEVDVTTRTRLVAVTSAGLLLSEPAMETLGLGQINFVLMAMVLADVLRRRPSRWQGVAVGLATAFKLTPGIFIVYLVVTRRFRAAVVAAGTFAATIGVGFLAMPSGSHSYWIDRLGMDPAHIGGINYIPNQSLLGSVTRAVGYDAARPWWMVAAVPILVAGAWLSVLVARRFGDLAGLAAIAFTGMLISPISWSHHWLWFLVPTLLGARHAYERRSPRLALAVGLWAAPFLIGPFWMVPESAWRLDHHPAGQLLLGSSYTILALLGLGVVAWLCRTAPGAAVPPRDA